MKLGLLIVLLLWYSSAIAQQVVYQSFDVDSAAEPRAGTPYLNTFLETNLRKPITVEAKGISGGVMVSAIVEPDGSVSDVKVVNSLRPDCDREAIRAFSLFKAWKPGFKGGKAVRQYITTTVLFKPNDPFIYTNGARISYYDGDEKALADSSDKVRYKQVAPVDSNGFASGDIVIYKENGGNWKETYRLPFVRQVNSQNGSSGKPTIRIGYQPITTLWEGEVLTLNEAGTMLSQSFYKNGLPTGEGMSYNLNGMVAEKRAEGEDGITSTAWYESGQIRDIRLTKKTTSTDKPALNSVTAFWSPTGQQLIKDGQGRVVYSEAIPSRADTARQTTLVEEGLYENGVKQGLWTGRYADGSYFYAEAYDKGICTGGKAHTIGGDTVRYAVAEQQPEFKGGMKGLGSFLAQNLRYPAVRAQGRVLVSFVVCTDGSLCDYVVLKPVHPELDKEALRVVQKMSGQWKPGSQHGQYVRAKYILPINFTHN